jgi:dsRNA-specific ribonuclease
LERSSAAKALADVLEALIGAVYLDSQGNLEVVMAVVIKMGIDYHKVIGS